LPFDRTAEPLPAMLAARAVAGRRAAKAAILENIACLSVDLTQQVIESECDEQDERQHRRAGRPSINIIALDLCRTPLWENRLEERIVRSADTTWYRMTLRGS
jgi:hypothetical protein